MSDATIAPPDASTAEVLDAAVRLFRQSLPATLPLAICAVIAGQAATAWDLAQGGVSAVRAPTDPVRWLLLLSGSLFNLLAFSAILLRIDALAAGRRAALRVALRDSLRKLPGLVALSLVCAVLLAVGVLLLVVPGVYLLGVLPLALPAYVLETRAGVLGSIDRALRLVRGRWLRTMAVLAVGALAVLVLLALGLVLGVIVGGFASGGDLSAALIVSSIVTTILSALFTPFALSLCLVQYRELQRRGAAS